MRISATLPQVKSVGAAPQVDFRHVFETELAYVWSALRRLGVPERDRADVAHDVFVAVHRQLERYDPSRPLRPWLFAFAFRCASDYRRRARHAHEVFGRDDDPLAEGRGVDETLAARSLLGRALDTLSEDKRAALVMHEIEGWPVAEIAAALEVPVQTIYSRLRVGRQELVQAVRRLQEREP